VRSAVEGFYLVLMTAATSLITNVIGAGVQLRVFRRRWLRRYRLSWRWVRLRTTVLTRNFHG
jgi:hypothetical protein